MRRSKPRVGRIGSVSHGTARAEDLLPRLLDAAGDLRLSKADRKEWRIIGAHLESANESDDEAYFTADGAGKDLEVLFDMLNDYSPAFCYFGAHEGDGSDYGWWISYDALDEAQYDGEVWRDPDDGESRMPAEARYRLVVSDHGNMTLYHRNGREVWGVV